MKKIIFLLTFSLQLLTFSTLHALDLGYAREDGGQAGAYLSWGAGARSLAMGKAYVGLSNDASAVYWNPAGLTQLENKELTALYASLWEKTSYSFVSYAQPMVKGVKVYSSKGVEGKELVAEEKNQGTIGIALVNLSSSGFNKRDQYNEEQGTTGLSETTGIISYARPLNSELSGGINLKIAKQQIDTYSAIGYGVDTGLLYKPKNIGPLTVGLSIQNLVAPRMKLKYETDKFPLDVRLGLAYRFMNDKLILAVDTDKTENRSLKMHYGIEYSPLNIFALRAGLDETEITAGFGLSIKNFSLDYAFGYQDAWKGHVDLGASHRFGMTYKWGK
jgi:hypothetical protein